MAKQKVKFYEVINWLFVDSEPPDYFNSNSLSGVVPYLTEQLWTHPKLVWYLNKHTNDLFKIPDALEQLKLIKKIIRINKITKYDLWTFIPERKKDIVQEIIDREEYDDGNARAKELMLKNNIGKQETQQLFQRQKVTRAALKQATTEDDKSLVIEAIQRKIKEEDKVLSKRASVKNTLLDINQKVIEEQELVLFDVSLLKKTNRILFTFIDKNNQKVYYTEPFVATIYISTREGVINNDYIEELNDDFNQYKIKDIGIYTRLKFMLNDNYKRTLNGSV